MKIMTQKKKIKHPVDLIIWDLSDRRGFDNEWSATDADIQEEIRETWKEIIDTELNRKMEEVVKFMEDELSKSEFNFKGETVVFADRVDAVINMTKIKYLKSLLNEKKAK